MKILNIAWKFDHDSAFSNNQNDNDECHFFYGFKILDENKKSRQVFPLLSYFTGVLVFLLNKIKVFGSGCGNEQLITLIKRNYLNEIIINHIIKKFEIDEINLHWCGYGFLPTRSLDFIRGLTKLNIIHHDWYHFTSGAHVPYMLESMPLANSFRVNHELNRPKVWNIFVSKFQFQQVKELKLINFSITENILRESFVSSVKDEPPNILYAKRILTSPQLIAVFIGVKLGNYDNKGVGSANYILQHLTNNGVFSIGIGCDDSLPLSLSFSSRSSPEVYRILSVCDLCIITSRLETFSMVALESQFCKTPVVFRRSLAPSSFEDSSYLFPSKDDSDQALLDTVLDCITVKRTI